MNFATSQIVTLKNQDILINADKQLLESLVEISTSEKDIWSKPKENRRAGAHSLFQYPGMMVPEVQRSLIRSIRQVQPGIERLYDPYMGSATSLVAGMYNGLNCYGQDVNPLSILIAKVKTASYNINNLSERTSILLSRIQNDKSFQIEIDFLGINKWFKAETSIELSKIRRAIMGESSVDIRRFFWLTLAETIRLTSNDRTSTYKLHARSLEEIESRQTYPIKVFSEIVRKNIIDLKRLAVDLESLGWWKNEKYTGSIHIDLLDTTQQLIGNYKEKKFDLLITSPPYGDNTTTIPYGEHAFLPLQWIELSDIHLNADKSFLRTTKEIDNRSLGGRVKALPQNTIYELEDNSKILSDTLKILKNGPAANYNKVAAFYLDLYKSVRLLCQAVESNAYMVWTLGNRRVSGIEIKNDLILNELLESQNCHPVIELNRTILNKRMPNRNPSGSTMANERILILRKQ